MDTGVDPCARVITPTKTVAFPVAENVSQVTSGPHVFTSHLNPVITPSTTTKREELVDCVRAGTVEFNADSTVTVTSVRSYLDLTPLLDQVNGEAQVNGEQRVYMPHMTPRQFLHFLHL